MKLIPRSLVTRLFLVALLVQVVSFSALLMNNDHQLDLFVEDNTRSRIEEINPLLSASLAPLVFTSDLASTQELLQRMLTGALSDLVYIEVRDLDDHIFATAGTAPARDAKHLLQPNESLYLASNEGLLHNRVPLTLAEEPLGSLEYGLSVENLHQLHNNLINETLWIAAMTLGLSVLLVGGIGYATSHRMGSLVKSANQVAKGDFTANLEMPGHDEVNLLSRSLQSMVNTIYQRNQELAQSHQQLGAIADYTYAWEVWLSDDGRVLWTNPSVQRMTGYTVEECMAIDRFPGPFLCEEQDAALFGALTMHTEGSGYECRVQRKDGRCFNAAVYWQSIPDENGQSLGIRASFIDISERYQAQQELHEKVQQLVTSEETQRELTQLSRREQARLRALLSAMNLGILFETPDKRVEYYNPAFEEMWAINSGVDLNGIPSQEVLTHSTHQFAKPAHSSKYVLSVHNTHEVSEQFEIEIADGRVLTQISYPVQDPDGRTMGRLWVYEDVTFERQTAEQLIYLAERDSLTGLCNRHRFQQELERMISLCDRYEHKFALIYFDLDEFKYINDTFGHREGDTVLTRIAGEVSNLVRGNDIFARLGGDEFAILILLQDADDEKKLSQLAHRLSGAISQLPFRFHGKNIRITTSIGISIYPDLGTTADELVAQADSAMYQAKGEGKNTWRVYNPERDISEAMVEFLSWNKRIENALENDLFELHFQGIYRIHEGQLQHLEALVRLRDEENPDQLLMPGQFIPLAEKSGKILDIDRWVIRAAIKNLATRSNLPSIAVNISGRSFDEPTLPQYIRNTLIEFDVPPERLIVELTETEAVSDIQDAQRFIEALHNTGCQVCLDDFGAGFSSFAYLKHLSADILKIDGMFIHDLGNNRENQIFLRAMLDVAHGLKKRTVAEFVDNEVTLAMLHKMGVDCAQGYYLDKPQRDHPALKEYDAFLI